MIAKFLAPLVCCSLFVTIAVSTAVPEAKHPLLKRLDRAIKIAGIKEEEVVTPQEEHHLRNVHHEDHGKEPRFFPGVLRLTFFDPFSIRPWGPLPSGPPGNGSDAFCQPPFFTHAELFELNKCIDMGNSSVKFRAWKTSKGNLGFTQDHWSKHDCTGHYSKHDNYFPYETCYFDSVFVTIEESMPLLPPPEVGNVAVISGFHDKKTCEKSFNLPLNAGHVQVVAIGACQRGSAQHHQPDTMLVACNNGLDYGTGLTIFSYNSTDGSCLGNVTDAKVWNQNGPECIHEDVDGENVAPIASTFVCVVYNDYLPYLIGPGPKPIINPSVQGVNPRERKPLMPNVVEKLQQMSLKKKKST